MPTLKVPDKDAEIDMHYEIIGEGTPLILIHGWLCNGRFWDDFHVFAEMGFQVIIPELRGHGESQAAKNVKIEELGEDINRLMDHLGISKAIVIGHSMGGITAQAFYHKYPEKVIALGLWNTGGRIPFGYGIWTLGYLCRIVSFAVGLLLAYPITGLFRFSLGKGWALSFKGWWKSQAYKDLVGYVKATNKKAVIKAAIALPGFKGIKKLKDIAVPTMLLHGKKDRYITPRQLAEKMDQEIPQSKLYIVENAAHFPPNEQPEEVIEYLVEFLKKTGNLNE
jgi:3-oxoadipate enol-lactonase